MPAAPLTTRDVARVLGVSEARVRQLVRAGWCAPARRGRRLAFDFQQLVVLRAAKGLEEARVPAARVRRALRALARELGDGRALSGVRIAADGRSVVVRDGRNKWEPESGQLVFDFSVDALAKRVAEVVGEEERSAGAASAEAPERARSVKRAAGAKPASAASGVDRALALRAYDDALALEESDPAAAQRAYRRALARDPGLVDAAVNLGRLAHEAGRAKEAVDLYQRALALTPDDAEIHYNLALALEDAAGAGAAIHHYEHALALDPRFADAHWNLAGLLEQTGRKADALRHYRAYEKLTR